MPIPYTTVLARNARVARVARDLDQEAVALRMRALGFSAWVRQTVQRVEREKRRLVAEEIFGLALALDTSIAALYAPPVPSDDNLIELPSGDLLPAAHVGTLAYGRNFGSVTWDGNKPVFTDQAPRGFRVLMPTPDPGVFTVDFPAGPQVFPAGPQAEDGE